MANYRQIHTQIWRDDWFFGLDPREKLLFMYLFANDSASLAGIYKLPKPIIAFETGLTPQFVDKTLEKFEQSGKVVYRDGIIWVINMGKYHNYKNPKVDARISADIEAIPASAIKNSYLIKHGMIEYAEGMDSLSIAYRYTGTKEKEKEKEEEKKEEKENTKEKAAAVVFKSYEREIGVITSTIADDIKSALEDYPADWFEMAFQESARQNKRSWKYALAILKRWKVDGFKVDTRSKPSNEGWQPAHGSRRRTPDMGDYVVRRTNEIVIIDDGTEVIDEM